MTLDFPIGSRPHQKIPRELSLNYEAKASRNLITGGQFSKLLVRESCKLFSGHFVNKQAQFDDFCFLFGFKEIISHKKKLDLVNFIFLIILPN